MTLQGYVKGSEDGWKFYGRFGDYKIEGGLDKPVKDFFIPHAELFNASVGSFSYHGVIGPQYLNLQSTTRPPVIITGQLAESIEPVRIAGWLQVAEIESE